MAEATAKPKWVQIGTLTVQRRQIIGWMLEDGNLKIILKVGDCSHVEWLENKEAAIEDLNRLQTENRL